MYAIKWKLKKNGKIGYALDTLLYNNKEMVELILIKAKEMFKYEAYLTIVKVKIEEVGE